MAWSGTVTNKSDSNGVYSVTVEYTNGTDTIFETYSSKSPHSTWIPDTVRNRIAQLDTMSSYDIAIGMVTPSDPPSVDANIALFARRFGLLPMVQSLIDLGIVSSDHAKIVAYKNWIAENLNDYIEILTG